MVVGGSIASFGTFSFLRPRSGGDDVMETTSRFLNDIWGTGKWLNAEPMCSDCRSGHTIVWYYEPPLECPYCNAPIVPEHRACDYSSDLPCSFFCW